MGSGLSSVTVPCDGLSGPCPTSSLLQGLRIGRSLCWGLSNLALCPTKEFNPSVAFHLQEFSCPPHFSHPSRPILCLLPNLYYDLSLFYLFICSLIYGHSELSEYKSYARFTPTLSLWGFGPQHTASAQNLWKAFLLEKLSDVCVNMLDAIQGILISITLNH